MLLIAVLFDAMLKTSEPPPAAADEGYWLGCCYFFRDDLWHRPVLPEYPAFFSWDITRPLPWLIWHACAWWLSRLSVLKSARHLARSPAPFRES